MSCLTMLIDIDALHHCCGLTGYVCLPICILAPRSNSWGDLLRELSYLHATRASHKKFYSPSSLATLKSRTSVLLQAASAGQTGLATGEHVSSPASARNRADPFGESAVW